jgi:hypothetical protein
MDLSVRRKIPSQTPQAASHAEKQSEKMLKVEPNPLCVQRRIKCVKIGGFFRCDRHTYEAPFGNKFCNRYCDVIRQVHRINPARRAARRPLSFLFSSAQ